jgi:hypothetical protein
MTLSAVTFAIYAADGQRGRLCGSGSNDDRVTSVTVSHGADDHLGQPSLQIETALNARHSHSSERALARDALARWLQDGLAGWSPGSDAALVLKLRAHERARHQIVSRATISDRVMYLDGAPISFAYVEAESRWAAVARAGPVTITVTASHVDPSTLRLRPVHEPIKSLI